MIYLKRRDYPRRTGLKEDGQTDRLLNCKVNGFRHGVRSVKSPCSLYVITGTPFDLISTRTVLRGTQDLEITLPYIHTSQVEQTLVGRLVCL